MCSITGVTQRLLKVFAQIGSKFLFPRQPIAFIDLKWGKCWDDSGFLIFYQIFVKLAGHEDRYKILDEWFRARSDFTAELLALEQWKFFPYSYHVPWRLHFWASNLQVTSHQILFEFKFWQYRTTSVTCPWVSKNTTFNLVRSFNRIFTRLDRHKISNKFKFRPDRLLTLELIVL